MDLPVIDHGGLIVADLDRAIAFFEALGLEAGDRRVLGGSWVDAVIGVAGVESEVVGLSLPGGGTWLELSRFRAPEAPGPAEELPSNALGLRHVTIQVADVGAALARVRALGYDTVGTVEDYEDVYRLCYLRGPDGIIVELAQRL